MDLTAAFGSTSGPVGDASESSFVRASCLPLLQKEQNADGGWGFHPGSQSRVEATCWVLRALICFPSSEGQKSIAGGFRFLRAAQLPDGSWPSTPGERVGSWVTSLACWVLLEDEEAGSAVALGLKWLCEDWPRDSTPWQRLLRRFSSRGRLFPQNDSYRGWGWTPHTSSWVEPTSFALLVLGLSPNGLLPTAAKRRQRLAEALLYDRMCPEGGWNCGNPLVYGVAGDPLVIPTSWALLALRRRPDRAEKSKSLEWLEKSIPKIQSAASLALARICVESYGRKWPAFAPDLSVFHRKNNFLQNVQVTAWACLAMTTSRPWLGGPPDHA